MKVCFFVNILILIVEKEVTMKYRGYRQSNFKLPQIFFKTQILVGIHNFWDPQVWGIGIGWDFAEAESLAVCKSR